MSILFYICAQIKPKNLMGEVRKYALTLTRKVTNRPAFKAEKKMNWEWFKNDKKLFQRAISVSSLKKAWYVTFYTNMRNNNSHNVKYEVINNSWFIIINQKLLKGSFKYTNDYPRKILAKRSIGNNTSFTIRNLRLKIIETAIVNALEPLFEGCFQWESIKKKTYYLKSLDVKNSQDYWVIKDWDEVKYEKKDIINKAIFLPNNYSFRPKKSIHQALNKIKHWKKNISFFIKYSFDTDFAKINCKRLKNIFNKYVCDTRFWSEISRMLRFFMAIEIESLFKQKQLAPTSKLSSLLFNIYLHELDEKVAGFTEKTLSNHFFWNSLSDNKLATDNKWKQKINHIEYIRYGNQFILGIEGNRSDTLSLRKKISFVLKSDLHLNVKKESLVHIYSNSLNFLDYEIKINEVNHKKRISKSFKEQRALKKNKNNSLLKFLEMDKKFTKVKSHQLYFKILSYFDIMLKKLNLMYKHKNYINLLAIFFIFKDIGLKIMKRLSFFNWKDFNQFLELLEQPKFFSSKNKKHMNPALNWWLYYLKIEISWLNWINTIVLKDKLKILDKSRLFEEMSKEQASKVKKLQTYYLNDLSSIMDNKANSNLNQRFDKVRDYFFTDWTRENEVLSSKYLCIKAPLIKLFKELKLAGYIHKLKNKSISNSKLKCYTDVKIITIYNSIIINLLNKFRGVSNFSKIKGLAQIIRKSCILTLASKHKKSQSWVYAIYGEQITVKKNMSLISWTVISNYPDNFNLKYSNFLGKSHNLKNVISK